MPDNMLPIFEKLATIFCTSVDFIQANATDYILQYGRYTVVKTFPINCLYALLIFGMLASMGWCFYMLASECCDAGPKVLRQIGYATFTVATVGAVTTALLDVAMYLWSPLMFSLEAVSKLL